MTKLKTQVVDHGIDGSQYFPGCGTAFTEYNGVATGCGDTFAEAIDDALESMAQSIDGVDFEQLERDIASDGYGKVQPDGTVKWQESRSASEECAKFNGGECPEESDTYYYVSIRYKRSEEA